MAVNGGIIYDDSALTSFNLVKFKKKDFVIFDIQDEKIVVPSIVFPNDNEKNLTVKDSEFNLVFQEFKTALVASKSPCYAVLDLRYMVEDLFRSKLVFFFWCPENVPVRKKMIAASTCVSFRNTLGLPSCLEIHEASDLDLNSIIKKFVGKN